MNPVDLQSLKEIFSDQSSHIVVGKVLKLELAADRSVLLSQCQVLTQDRTVIARVCWDAIGPNAGVIQFPIVGDIVLLEFAEGDHEQCYLTKRLSNKTDKIPIQAVNGDIVSRSLAGKKNYLLSDTKICLGKGGASDPTEPLVLGTVMKACIDELIDRIDAHLLKIKTGPLVISQMPGYLAPTAPALVADLEAIRVTLAANKSTYTTTASTNIVSQLGFTER
jgi:hypothetical protein